MMLALGNYLCRRHAGTNSTAKCRVPTDSFRARTHTSGVPERDTTYERRFDVVRRTDNTRGVEIVG